MVEGQEACSQYFYGFRRDRSKIVRRGGVCWSVGGTTITNHRGRSWNRGARNMETGRPVQMTRDNVFPPSVFCQARLRPGTFRLAEKLWRSILVRTASKGDAVSSDSRRLADHRWYYCLSLRCQLHRISDRKSNLQSFATLFHRVSISICSRNFINLKLVWWRTSLLGSHAAYQLYVN